MAKKPKLVPAASASHEEPPADQTPSPTPAPVEPPETPANPPPAEPQAGPDYRTMYGESTREFQVLHARQKEVESQLEKLTSNAPITDDEMRASDPDWDVRTEYEQQMAKRQLFNDRRMNRLELEREQERLERQNAATLASVIATNPELSRRKAEFEAYIAMPSHKGAPMDVLVKAFLHDNAAPAAPASSGPVLQPGSGGPKDAPRPKIADGTISAEEASQLRLKDPKKWSELARAGKIRY